MKNVTLNNGNLLNASVPNVIENNLLYFAAITSEIGNVVSQTYGPYSGYVANLTNGSEGMSYTKDGFTTLLKMSFNSEMDNSVLQLVRGLARQIKKTSGDGSTTGAKILANIVKRAAEDIQNDSDGKYMTRIMTPKAIELINKDIEKILNKNANKLVDYDDIVNAAFISVNNDDELVKPFKEIRDMMIDTKMEITPDIEIGVFNSIGTETTIDVNPGMELGTHRYVCHPQGTELNNVRVVLLSNIITNDMGYYILNGMMQDAIAHFTATSEKVVYIVGGMDPECKEMVRRVQATLLEKNQPLAFDFIEMVHDHNFSANRREDLMYFLAIDTINLQEFVEKRPEPLVPGVDSLDNTNLLKWKVTTRVDENKIKRVVDDLWGARRYQEALDVQLTKGHLSNIRYIAGVGLSITPVDHKDVDNPLFRQHVESLRAMAEDTTKPEPAEMAKQRLFFLKEKYFAINVGKRLNDIERVTHAYRDAANAISAIFTSGFHMGGSVGAIIALTELRDMYVEKEFKNTRLKEVCIYLVELLLESYKDVVPALFPRVSDANGPITYDKAIKDGLINTEDFTFLGTKVIAPVMSDITIINTVMLQFSNLYSSLMIETTNVDEIFQIKRVTQNVVDKLSKKSIEVEEVKKDDKTPKAEFKGIELVDGNGDTIKTTKEVQEGLDKLNEVDNKTMEEVINDVYKEEVKEEVHVASTPKVTPVTPLAVPNPSTSEEVKQPEVKEVVEPKPEPAIPTPTEVKEASAPREETIEELMARKEAEYKAQDELIDKKILNQRLQDYRKKLTLYNPDGTILHTAPAEETERLISESLEPKVVVLVDKSANSGIGIGIEVANFVNDKEAKKAFMSLSESIDGIDELEGDVPSEEF